MAFLPTELIRPQTDTNVGEHRLRAFTLSSLREVLKGYGVELAPIMRQVGLRLNVLDDDFIWIPLDKFASVLTISAKVTGDHCFGLKYGALARFTSNPLGYLMANAPNLKTALKSFAHFHTVISSNTLKFVESNGGGRIEWSYSVTVSNSVQLTDFVLMRFVSRIQSAVGSAWRPLSVGVTHRRPADLAEYERLLRTKIAFDQPINSIAIAGSTLMLPMPQADPQLFKLITRYCEEQLERQKATEHPLNQIREAMICCLEQSSYGPKDVGKALGITPSVLHRRLKAEGTSFQKLLDDTRRCLTHRYLIETSLKLTDIAAKVGYSELSAFSRAARRWFGMSPRTVRRRPPNLDEAA
jgi:AraC-like DNA-binding protein